MSDTSNIEVKLKSKVLGYELHCINCHKLKYNGNHDIDNTLTVALKSKVLGDNKCENCGCNTFNITVFIKVEME